MKNSKKDLIVTVLFVTFITAVFLGTVFTNARVIAWNVIKNNERYITEDTINSKVRSYVTAYENSFNDNIFVKDECVDFFGLLQKAMAGSPRRRFGESPGNWDFHAHRKPPRHVSRPVSNTGQR